VLDRREVLAAMTERNAAHHDSVIMSSHLASALERGRGYLIVLVRT
jgi:hypothetical protein